MLFCMAFFLTKMSAAVILEQRFKHTFTLPLNECGMPTGTNCSSIGDAIQLVCASRLQEDIAVDYTGLSDICLYDINGLLFLR